MAEEVNSKAPAASSTANRCGVPSQNRGKDVDVRPGACTPSNAGPLVEVSGYDLPNRVPRSAPGYCDKSPENAFTPVAFTFALRLAQHDKCKAEDDRRGDHGSELGKYRPQSARSELRCLAPCSPAKILHVGLHVATPCWAHRPATAGARASKWWVDARK